MPDTAAYQMDILMPGVSLPSLSVLFQGGSEILPAVRFLAF